MAGAALEHDGAMRSYYPKVYSCLEWQLYTHPINPISPSWIAAIASNNP
jgi:hypothetical protein